MELSGGSMNKLLVVVDMIEGFVNFGKLSDKNINRIVPNVENLIKEAIKSGDKIIAFIDTHKKDDAELIKYPEHCIGGTRECELIPELQKYKNQMLIIEKNTTDGFQVPRCKRLVATNNFSEVKICGCCTDICVKDFTESLLKFYEITKSSTKVKIMSDACDTFWTKGHNADEVNQKTMRELQKKGAIISKTKEKCDEKNY